ncbi:MAG TPA: AAA family ATPase [Xanthomonadales bacterium]|nr:AAA family ATPase [Xanthomonadales bacterium]
MYLQFFGLTEAPFSITPDPAFVYLSAAHRDALAHLLYGVGKGGAGGFVQLTGEVGTGKTTLCRCLLEQVPDDTIIALILNPMVTPKELLAAICEELDINVDGIRDSTKSMVDELNVCLLHHHAQGRRVVVVIDEAQNLSPEALEQVRLLTNLETAKHKLLQMVLLGQPELRQLLQRQNLRQLAQRITARYHLAPLQEKETVAYVRHRMQVAGARHNPFTRSAMRALHKCSGGVPRLINIIADRALAGAYAREKERVDASMVRNAANEVRPSEIHVRSGPSPLLLSGTALVAFLMVAAVVLELSWQSREQVELPHVTQTSPSAEDTDSRRTPEATGAQPATTAAIQADVVPPAATSKSKNAAMAEEMQAVPTAQSLPLEQVWPLDTDWLIRQQGLAWAGLAELWQDPGAAYAIQTACDGQDRTGYACLRDQGSWSRVKK